MITSVMQIPNSQRDQMVEQGRKVANHRNSFLADRIRSGEVESWDAETIAVMIWNEEF